MCTPELGIKGPILGTIHSSKGREAEDVFLYLNQKGGAPKNRHKKYYLEESRVLFVGASRARASLNVLKARPIFAVNLSSGRTFKKLGKKRNVKYAQVEFGRDDDFDLFSPVATTFADDKQSLGLQRKLSKLFKATPIPANAELDYTNNYSYEIFVSPSGEDRIRVGSFNQQVNFDLFNVQKRISRSNPKTPSSIPYLNFFGIQSVVVKEGDERLNCVNPTFRRSGFWLAPIISGFSTCYFR